MDSGDVSNQHHKFGQAPMASFEDFTEGIDNDEQLVRFAGTSHVTISTPRESLKTPSAPRIDISRASSSSYHEDSSNSRESSPERELLAGEEPAAGCKLQLNYKEDHQDLRSSTEELDLADPIHEQDFKREAIRSRKRQNEDKLQAEYSLSIKPQERERKDSNCSEIILLNISGRTSRLSSVGSQGSGHSGKLSVASNVSSRSPSPHKCLLETSFCGHNATQFNNSIGPTKLESEDIEKILLRREADTTKALIPRDIKFQTRDGNLKPDPLDKPKRRGREERKEFFRKEVEITKRVLEEANIEVKRGSDFTDPVSTYSCPKLQRNLFTKRKGSFDNLKMFSKCREKLCIDQSRPVTNETKNRSLFSSTLSLFKKKERKKSFKAVSENELNNDKLECYFLNGSKEGKFSFESDKKYAESEHRIQYFLDTSLKHENVLPSESISMPIETPTQLLDEYDLQRRLDNNEHSIGNDGRCLINDSNKCSGKLTSSIFNSEMPITIYNEQKEYGKSSDNENSNLNFSPTKRDTLRVKRRCEEDQEITNVSSELNVNFMFASRQKIQRRKQIIYEQNKMSLQFPTEILKGCSESELEHNSSESEKDSEIEILRSKSETCFEDNYDERESLFYEDSVDEDYCIMPPSLRAEKYNTVPILPTRERHLEVRIIPIERPRSTTPINPTLLDNFVMHTSLDEPCTEKMKIFLPNVENYKLKNDRKLSANTFIEFADKVQQKVQKNISKIPKSPSTSLKLLNSQPRNWINFNEIPERRKIPKRIQTIPRSEDERINALNYVHPEECSDSSLEGSSSLDDSPLQVTLKQSNHSS